MSTRKQTILIVDDVIMNRALLTDMLGDEYEIIEAENGVEALSIIRDMGSRISLILLDIVMPEMDGLECLEVMNKNGWTTDIPVIMVSAETKPETIKKAYDLGATDFVNRPFDSSIVRKRVMNTLALYTKQAALIDMVESEMRHRERSVSTMVSVLSQIVEFRNGESGRHVLNVNTLTELLLRQVAQKTDQYNLTAETISIAKLASSLHDIGKVAIPENILNKPGKLTEKEFEIMKGHSAAGSDMLDGIPGIENEPIIRISRDICRWHHERYDGRGYPDGLKGEEIPITAQVVALADVYDALTSERCYKAAFTHEKAIKMIKNGECGAFNPFLLECLDEVADIIPETLAKSTFASDDGMKDVISYTLSTDPINPDISVSERTLDLLDYERMKYNFFAQMSDEVQFEYTPNPPMASIHDYSQRKLGLPEILIDPMHSDELINIFGEEAMDAFHKAIEESSYDSPVVQMDLLGHVDGESRWFHLDARTMWEDEGNVFIGLIGKLVDVHDSHKKMTDLEQKATRDSLTGLMNHAYARQQISTRLRECPEGMFVLMVLDMDKFKDANDTHGHLFGDNVLKCLAQSLSDSVRDGDVVARVGGDEFLICMEVDGDPKPLVERIFDRCTGEYDGFPIRLSMGIDIAYGAERTYDEMFNRADNALYEKKRNGRGGFVYSDEIEDVENVGSVISNIESDEK